jgi:hypothetical protein
MQGRPITVLSTRMRFRGGSASYTGELMSAILADHLRRLRPLCTAGEHRVAAVEMAW